MNNQSNLEPEYFQVKRYFGPLIGEACLPNEVISSLIEMSDKVLKSDLAKSHGDNLAGVINIEKKIHKSDMIEFQVDLFLESCLRSYVTHCARLKPNFSQTYLIESIQRKIGSS